MVVADSDWSAQRRGERRAKRVRSTAKLGSGQQSLNDLIRLQEE
jgi:hypothetical protein